MNENKQSLITSGIPYGPDKNKLSDCFPVQETKEGDLVSHERLAEVLGYEVGSQRYYGVINSWRNDYKRQFGVIMEWEPGMGLRVLRPHEHLQHCETGLRRSAKRVGRKVRELGYVQRDRLDERGRARYDHMTRNAAILAKAAIDARKHFAVEIAPVQSLPKRILGERKAG
jgi:hypothetical protein